MYLQFVFITDTSRIPRHNEVEGEDFYFVTKEEFESDLNRDRFLEYKEVKGAYYGSSFITIKKIIENSRVPILDVNPQVRIYYNNIVLAV